MSKRKLDGEENQERKVHGVVINQEAMLGEVILGEAINLEVIHGLVKTPSGVKDKILCRKAIQVGLKLEIKEAKISDSENHKILKLKFKR